MGVLSAIDLHCHSLASDGALAPAEVVARAAANGVRVLALTDHDTVAGLDEAGAAAQRHGVELVPGLELSVTWAGGDLHVVALGVDPTHPALTRLLDGQVAARDDRAARIAHKLERAGVDGALNAARAEAGEGAIGRAHFARALVARGVVDSHQAAFRRYLARGRRAYVGSGWVAMTEGVEAIHAAGGRAVLAHPTRYGLTATKLSRACTAFAEAGGDGIEVVVGGGGPGDLDAARSRALRLGLTASLGSDFHEPAQRWRELGHLRPLPGELVPVWQGWDRVEALTDARGLARQAI
ncbi:PHP domain-containing protein [Arhodomonas aquaeolei]|uniref:PHP domain-containing protein n=1 Tax=Arhodomonas aquaeolei TaxID=2369 RepID=UPI00037D775F|nr:PHP domain-containing protein [Arhodomonas aquaeolei]